MITFSNKSAFHVRALWIDFSGNEVGVRLYTGGECLIKGLRQLSLCAWESIASCACADTCIPCLPAPQVVYSVLEPNSTRRYHTYQTHPWIVRELHTGTRMLMSECPAVVGLSAEQTVEIQAPPQLEWSVSVSRVGNASAFETASPSSCLRLQPSTQVCWALSLGCAVLLPII